MDEIEEEFFDNEKPETYSEIKKTPPIMSMFEKVKVISERISQLNKGYRSNIEDVIGEKKLIKSFDIAMTEFEMNKLPKYFVKRVLPNNTYELWSHEDFEFFPRN